MIGYSSTNTNRVNIPTESESCDIDTPITFNANLFKEVLVANRECSSAILEVSTEGLARVNFKIDDYDSTYYIVYAGCRLMKYYYKLKVMNIYFK